ncbi:acyl-CoA thioesterase [Cerasicoccus arenae]|uniref:Thioesterase n=1 Tax=Cerasicoccus arenae TaxID=424488 RepID=A0A8J3GBE1_9BACT|nr:thioesterase family protein [Cerasicoccus arenae]MBK1856980.1 thioesterase family protein [Cerasicoccus arenae]GHB90197.1 thioesterase [Cerasicoccus arenae]
MPTSQAGVFTHNFSVTTEAIDGNNHVNNVVYVQWMQDVAIAHSTASGGFAAVEASSGTWVARSHHIEYLKPALLRDVLLARTWVADVSKVRSRRRYQFHRESDGALIAQGETDWVFVDTETGRPMAIPESVRACYRVVEK